MRLEKLDKDIARQWALFGLREISEQLEQHGAVFSAKRLNELIPIVEAELKNMTQAAQFQVNENENEQSQPGDIPRTREAEFGTF